MSITVKSIYSAHRGFITIKKKWGQINTTDDRYWILDASAKYGITNEKIVLR